jgi:hypothetical protein
VVSCDIYSVATGASDIREETEDEEGTVSSAWAWVAGVASDDFIVVGESEEDDEDEDSEEEEEEDEDISVRMTASALAAASVAMLAM